jgi:hypothetical protein
MRRLERAHELPPSDCVSCKLQVVNKNQAAENHPAARKQFPLRLDAGPSRYSGYKLPLIPARFIPQGEFDPVPKSELVIDHAEIILHHVFRGADGVRYLVVLQSLGYKLDDAVFALTGCTGSIAVV